MLKLPVCPYCSAEFLYPAVKKRMGGGTGVCPHCGKTFRVVKKHRIFLIGVAILILSCCDFLLLRIETMNLLFLTVFTAVGMTAVYFLFPYTVRYKPLK